MGGWGICWSYAHIVLCVLALVSCRDNSPIGASKLLTSEAYFMARTRLECEELVHCGEFTAFERCLATSMPWHLADSKAAKLNEGAGILAFDPNAASSCLDTWQRGRCPVRAPPVCATVFRGLSPIGGLCYPSGQDACLEGVCDELCGVCVRQLPNGALCGNLGPFERCAAICDGLKCVPFPELAGDFCDTVRGSCPSHLSCQPMPEGASAGSYRCVERLTIGEPCSGSSGPPCVVGGFCDDLKSHRCVLSARLGETCAGRPCWPEPDLVCDVQSKSCKLSRLPGETCINHDDCSTWRCSAKSGVCVGPSGVGEDCSAISGIPGLKSCVHSACRGGVCVNAETNSSCSNSEECQSVQALCLDGMCRLPWCGE